MTEQEFRREFLDRLEALAEVPTAMRRAEERSQRMEQRYVRFTHRVAFALALLFTAAAVFAYAIVGVVFPGIEQSRRAALEQVCRDQKTLLALVPANYPPLLAALAKHPDSSLNPNRNCRDFATMAINHR